MRVEIIAGIGIIVAVIGVLWYGTWRYMRKKFVRYTEEIEGFIQQIQEGKDLSTEIAYSETLSSKTKQELLRLEEIFRNEQKKAVGQKQEVQQMVSDISHQLKTPISNIVMYQDMLLARQNERGEGLNEEERNWILIMQAQVKKLDFLVQALLKMSRLESSMIAMKIQEENLYQCIAEAAAQVTRQAEEKCMNVQVECAEDIFLPLDRKWTIEAIGNVLDNAVKYSPEGGNIRIAAENLGMFVRIDVSDNGPGIDEKYYADIFKRFWRAPEVHQEKGVGIGLYLTREILTKQGGYCKVGVSASGGTRFSIYLMK